MNVNSSRHLNLCSFSLAQSVICCKICYAASYTKMPCRIGMHNFYAELLRRPATWNMYVEQLFGTAMPIWTHGYLSNFRMLVSFGCSSSACNLKFFYWIFWIKPLSCLLKRLALTLITGPTEAWTDSSASYLSASMITS